MVKKTRTPFSRSAVSLAVAAALPSAALAQDASEEEAIEEIVTVGIRTSVLDSTNTKRLADSISDVVDAGPLGYLPDQSIADALGRVPGVTTIRDSGQSSQLNIRGMNGDFIQTTLNGREQPSTAGYSEATRWNSFDQYPAELIRQAAVYKSPKASHIEGGVAGLVELKTVNPLDAPKQHNAVFTARASYNDAADDYGADANGTRFTGSYQGKFADDTVGIAVGYSYLDQPNAFIFSRGGADSQLGFGTTNINGEDVSIPRAFQWQGGSGNDERTGIAATLVFEPNDKIRATVDYFRSEFDRGDARQGITVGGLDEDEATRIITNPVIENGLLTSATITPTDPNLTNQSHPWFEARTEDQTTSAETDTIGINFEWYITDSSTLTVDWYTADGTKTREDRIASMHAYEPGGGAELAGQSFTYTLNGQRVATGAFGGVDFTDASQIQLSRYERYPHEYTDEIDAFKVDFKQDVEWGPISSFEVGVRVSDRTFGADRGTFLYGSRSGQGTGWCEDDTSSLPACTPQSIDGFVKVQSLPGVPDHFTIRNINALGRSIFGAGGDAGVKLFSRDWTFIESNDIEEETEAVYLMFNLDFQLGNVPVSGNFGVRYVDSDVKTVGLQNVGGGNGVPITDGVGVTNDYLAPVSYGPEESETLPALNLNFELTDNDVLRFAYAQVMGRPPVGQMKGGAGSWFGGTINDPGSPVDGLTEYNVWTNGTPYLDPFRADQFDLSYEHYFEEGGAVTVAVFYKDIESLVEGPTQFTFADGNVPDPDDLGLIVPDGHFLNIYQTYLNNDLGGYIQGIELAGTKTFDGLPGYWGGLGVTASYSYTDSETEVGGGAFYNRNLPLPGLSENVWSATVFYDWGGFSAHVNMRYRDEFVQNLPIPGAGSPTLAQDYTTMDAQVGYAFDNGLSIVVSGNNLTDEENIIEYGVDGAFGEFKQFGRQYYFGLNYKY
ncbi:MAG: TonB-dependent receptor [Woeseiaceae bacterium]|nr:TonB-dependent receptor [Woeseiaceae bacterium]